MRGKSISDGVGIGGPLLERITIAIILRRRMPGENFSPPSPIGRTPLWLASRPAAFGWVLLRSIGGRSAADLYVRNIRAGRSAAIRNRVGLIGRLLFNRDVIGVTTGDGGVEREAAI